MTNNQKYARFPRSAFVGGFDHIFKELEDMTKHAADHYPPHNIIKDEDMKYRIEVATAGFKEEELSVELKDGILEVNGDHTPRGLEFIHKGISTRKFHRSFRLSEYTQVTGASLENGILAIHLEVVLPEEKKPRKIEINNRSEVTTNAELLTESR
jgi:molecular chaperone IbpA